MVDIKDVPRDTALPWLHIALDGEGMRHRLQPHFGPQAEILQVKVGRFTYKPGRNARVAYRVKLLDRERNTKTRHVLHGRMERQEEIAHLYRKMSKRVWVTPPHGPALLCFEDLGLLLWGFPNDPKLPGLGTVARPEPMLALARSIPALAAQDPRSCESTAVKYVPGKRLVMKHRLTLGTGKHALVYSKTYAHGRGTSIHAVMRRLWEESQGDPRSLACPEPLAWSEELATLVLRALPGTAAIGTLADGHAAERMAAAGYGLARIHASGVGGLEAWSAADETENFVKATRILARYDGALTPALDRLRAAATASAPKPGTRPEVAIHGAFRFTQLLAYRDRLALVDFDGFRQGDPLCDAGSFVAHLLYLQAKGELDDASCEEAIAAFLGAYAAAAPAVDAATLHWYTAVILVAKHALKCVKRLKDDGDIKIRHLVAAAQDLLDGRRALPGR